MSDTTALPQHQIEQIVFCIKTSMSDSTPKQIEQVCSAIRQELSSPTAMNRFELLLDRYYKSNNDLTNKLELFHQNLLKNQDQIATLLRQILDSSAIACPNNPDLELIRQWLEELLIGDEYKLKQQVRDLLESGIARGLRNLVITYITITTIVAAATGVIGYFALSSSITNQIQKLKGVENGIKP